MSNCIICFWIGFAFAMVLAAMVIAELVRTRMRIPRCRVPGAYGAEAREIQKDYEKRLAEYAEVLVDDWDGDWGSVIRLLRYKLQRTRDRIDEEERHVGYEKTVAEMDRVIALLQRVIDAPHHDEVFKDFYSRHGRPDMVLGELNERDCCPVEFIYANGRPATEEMHAENKLLYEAEDASYQKDINEAFGLMASQMQGWWT